MVAQLQLKYYTPEKYLELEEKSDTKNEYLDGEIIHKAGGATNHNQIAINFCRAFPLTIGDRDYYIYINDVKLWIPAYRFYTYPDLMIIEGKPVYQSENSNIVTNQCFISIMIDYIIFINTIIGFLWFTKTNV
ncbi:Uma2 family endonuclease [Cyanobacterium aponinum UTEX 3222]|uniref:Uma2 family endonuclease n=1 Tax=Cyanobacterium aponinum TaxID=379064 RepID=UPI00308EFA43|nr:Uma2 family endonuclease [Cyanobacterium aponinum UTEX 3222]